MTTEQAVNVNALMRTTPMQLALPPKASGKDETLKVHSLIDQGEASRLMAALDLGEHTLCGLTMPRLMKEAASSTNMPLEVILTEASLYTDLLATFRDLAEMDAEMASLLSKDFRYEPELLRRPSSSQRYTGEHSFIDCHSDSSDASEAEPKSLYPNIFVGIMQDADGAKLKNKFILASTTMNLLFPSSVILSKKDDVQIGPDVTIPPSIINSRDVRVFYRRTALEHFRKDLPQKEEVEDHTTGAGTRPLLPSAKNVSCVRQFVCGFHHPSTYAFWRASVPGFQDPLYIPTTVRTLCDLPYFDGYGVGEKACAILAPRFLQLLAINHHNAEGIVEMARFDELLQMYKGVSNDKTDVKPWMAVHGTTAITDEGNPIVDLCLTNI